MAKINFKLLTQEHRTGTNSTFWLTTVYKRKRFFGWKPIAQYKHANRKGLFSSMEKLTKHYVTVLWELQN